MRCILASTSPYRRALLARVGLNFECLAPDYREEPLPGLSALELVQAHARGKALSLAERYPEACVIGSDQGLIFEGTLMGKPHHFEAACAQLERMQGRQAELVTAVFLYRHVDRRSLAFVNRAQLDFRALGRAEIEAYVRADMPLDCAGSFKVESRGPILFKRLISDDPTAIEGLPIMGMLTALEQFEQGG